MAGVGRSRSGQGPLSSGGGGQRPQPSSSSSCGGGQRPEPSSSGGRGAVQRPQPSSSFPGGRGAGQRPQPSSSSGGRGVGQRPQPSSSSSSGGRGVGQRPQPSSSSGGRGVGQRPQPSSSSGGRGVGQRPQPSSSSGGRGAGQRPPSGASRQPRSSRVPRPAHRKLRFVNWEGEHLWLYLRALGFDRKAAGSGVQVGPTMFKKPNASAFYVIAHFLFAKLDKLRAAKVFGNCSLPVGVLTATEFRKKCCLWLREIANEDQSRLPKFAPSALISPGGPKFIHLMYQLARHAVLEDMKRNSIGTDIPFAEAVKLTPRGVNMASARCRVASNKLLQFLQKENLLIQEYKKKEQLLIKEIKQIKSEYEVLQIKSFKMKQNDQNKNDKTERIQKVRSMWTVIMEIITSLTKEKEAVDYVLQGCVSQYVLDGASVVFRIPQLLAHRIESDVHQHWSGNVYKAGKLNFLMVIQLLNEALRTLRDEICQSEVTPQFAYIKDITVKCTQALQNLQSIRLKLKQQHYMSRSESISREQEDWEAKWKNFLGMCPSNLMLKQNPQLGLLRASQPHSFHPSEDDDDNSMFYQHLVSVSDIYDSVHKVRNEKVSDASSSVMDAATAASRWISSVPSELSKACENRDAFIEKNLPIEACKGDKMPVPPKILKNGKDYSAISEALENTGDHITRTESPVKKEDPLKKSSDELAGEIARMVMSESPQSDEDSGMALEDILSSVAFNPFLIRKQTPRTPENLLTEIRSSWRKAVQTDNSSDIELPPAKVMREEAPVDAGPIMQKVADSRLMCSTHLSPVPDSDPFLSERKSLLSSTKFRPQKQMRISHIIESPILETSGMQESERTGEQKLKCIGNTSVQNVNSGEDPEQSSSCVKKSMNTPGSCSENNSIIDVLPSDHFQDSLMGTMLNQDVSPLLSSVSCKASISWILDETFPEELDSMNTTKSASSDSDFDVTITDVTCGSKNKGDIQESKLHLQSLFNTHKVLKKTASTSEEESHQTRNGGESVSCTSDKNLKPEKREGDELFSPLELFTLDEAFTKTPLPTSLNERKYSLSSLLVSCQRLEEMASMVHDVPLSLITKFKDKEQLNEEPGTKEPSSG
ncbi:HAUS augmin-like complex subunit 6 [Numenius arquata]|uniref:HAUS augmin-like complex subunit 6 n=1 Tax=Numenius arquata TaxID=31919 RepID=UPI003D30AF21